MHWRAAACALIVLGFCGWWIACRPASAQERTEFVQRLETERGRARATRLRQRLAGEDAPSLLRVWWTYMAMRGEDATAQRGSGDDSAPD